MKKLLTLLLTLCLGLSLWSQESLFDPALEPFYHGVASGDPLSDRVIIWTRVTMDQPSVDINWTVATDTELTNVVATGMFSTDASRDYTVKVDVDGLSPNTTYYYVFETGGKYSLIGRTKTAPIEEVDNLKFALVSCSNHPEGYFNVYGRIADRNDLDAVFHVGDYIYEYGEGTFGDTTLADRLPIPSTEIITLQDYRARYGQYRLDAQLRRAHQQHPWIVTWDDHEITNDTYNEGAENHNEGEGDFFVRKAAAKKAYFEWLPIRENDGQKVFRDFSYGGLADVIVLDTRHEDRSIQPTSMLQPDFNDLRSLLGEEQKAWLFDKLSSSTAKWKIVPQQVMIAPFNVGFAAADITDEAQVLGTEAIFLDIWDGYPAERQQIFNYIAEQNIDNVVILSGDIHSSFANDLTATPVFYPLPDFSYLPVANPAYDPVTGAGSVGVEFVTPSVTSDNFDEAVGPEVSAGFEFAINNNLELPPGSGQLFNYNPHIKYNDLDRNGYVVVDIKPEGVQGDFFYVSGIKEVMDGETFGAGYITQDGANHLEAAEAQALPKAEQATPAPANPPVMNTTAKVQFIHNANSQTIDAYVNGDLALDNFAYKTATPYVELPAGVELNIGLALPNSSSAEEAILNITAVLEAGESYIVVAHGTFDESDEFPITIAIYDAGQETASSSDNVDVLFFHGSPDAPEVDIVSGGNVVFDNTDYGSFSPSYVSLPANTEYVLDVTPAEDNETIVASYFARFGFWKGKTAVVFATGFLGDETFQPWVALSNGGTYQLFPPKDEQSNFFNFKVNAAEQFIPQDQNILITNLYPIPTPGYSQLRFVTNKEGQMNIDVVNIDGKVVRGIFAGYRDMGAFRIEEDFSDLPNGTYFYRITLEDELVTKQFTISK